MHLLFLMLLSWLHPFYVSVTTIEHSKDKKNIQISSRIFYDDLERAINEEMNAKVDLKNPKNEAQNNQFIQKYFDEKFQILVNGKAVKANYLGYDIESEAAWCFLEIKNAGKVSKIEVRNALLYKTFKEQTHLYHFEINGKKKSTKVHNPESKVVTSF